MDRRQQKTRQAIFEAFSHLLKKKSFHSLTVQEIIKEANIGRSTFYAHFATKDELLRVLCADIFDHVFSEHRDKEVSHDFSDASYDLEQRITHILYHLRDNKAEIRTLLMGESSELFLDYFKNYLPALFGSMLEQAQTKLPQSFLQNYLTGSFADTVKWWVRQDMAMAPEQVAACYLTVVKHGVSG